jgi:hypothetical protein
MESSSARIVTTALNHQRSGNPAAAERFFRESLAGSPDVVPVMALTPGELTAQGVRRVAGMPADISMKW